MNKTKNVFHNLSVKKSIDDNKNKKKLDEKNDNENEKNKIRKL